MSQVPSNPTGIPKPRLLDQVRDAIRVRHYSIRTEEAYVQWIRRFILFHDKRRPNEMGETEINGFLSHLAVENKVSSSTQNQALRALIFLYKEVPHREIFLSEELVRAKKPKKLPVVLTREEVRSVLDGLNGVSWIMGNLLYGAGLRLMECIRLRVKDIDFSYSQIVVREGKGNKDRVTMLPQRVKEPLRRRLETVKKLHDQELSQGFGQVYLPYALEVKCPIRSEVKYPNAHREWGWQYVFPAAQRSVDPRSGAVRRRHPGEQILQGAVKKAIRGAGIYKHASCHTFAIPLPSISSRKDTKFEPSRNSWGTRT